MVSKSSAEAVATVIAPVSSSMAKASPVFPAVMDHEMESSSPVLARSTTVVEAVAVSETVPVSSSGDDGRHVRDGDGDGLGGMRWRKPGPSGCRSAWSRSRGRGGGHGDHAGAGVDREGVAGGVRR